MLDNPRFLERSESAVPFNSLEPLHGQIDDDRFADFSDVDAALLEVGLTTHLAGGVELGGADAVGISPAYLRALAGYFTSSCHSESMVALPHQTSNYGPFPLFRRPHSFHHRP